jgi:hypothetical protein
MPHTRTTRALVTAAVLVSAVALGGCGDSGAPAGGSSPTASAGSASASPTTPAEPSMGELYTKVRAAALAAKSGHLSGTVTQDGQKTSMDVAGLADGSNQKLVIGVGEGKGKAEILTVGGKYYMSGDKRFWKEQTGDAKAADLLVDKYVLVSAADAKELGDLSLGALLKEMFEQSELSTLEKLTSSVETRTEDGAKVWVASDGSGSEIWVDPETELPVKIVVSGDDAGELTFDSWNSAKKVAAPPAKDVVKP